MRAEKLEPEVLLQCVFYANNIDTYVLRQSIIQCYLSRSACLIPPTAGAGILAPTQDPS